MEKFSLLGVDVSAVNLESAFRQIEDWIISRRKAYICIAPVSTIVACREDARYKDIINKADMVTPDGMPVVWYARWHGNKQVRRTYGPDLMQLVCDQGRTRNFKHYLLGGTEEVNAGLEKVLKEQYPGIQIAGRFSPPFGDSPACEEETVARINRTDPDIIWVGLGSPKQDFWMSQCRDRIHAPVMIGVGAAFDFLSGAKPQAPRLMRQMGLEWFFRLCCEPRRLWKRYFWGNTIFLWLLFQENFKVKKKNAK